MRQDDQGPASDQTARLFALAGQASARKLRLFGCAICRVVWEDLTPHSCRQAVEVAERYADGAADDRELNRARSMACAAAQRAWRHGSRGRALHSGRTREARQSLTGGVALANEVLAHWLTRSLAVFCSGTDQVLRAAAPALLQDILGSPSGDWSFDPSWRTEAAVGLARRMYESRDFSAAPALADALETAGCGDAAVLGHLRGGGGHVRGCWVVDGVLGLA